MPGKLPTNEVVGVAWLAQRVPGLTAAMVATSLPGPDNGGALPWQETGFVQLQHISGRGAEVDIPVRRPVFQLDAYFAPKVGSIKPPWGEANALLELVRDATEVSTALYGRPLTLPAAFRVARVQAAYLITEPVRITADPSGYARYSLDLAIDWVVNP